ncbi:MAG: DUF6259 domain-containing protein [Thermoguttaceae bacterium]
MAGPVCDTSPCTTMIGPEGRRRPKSRPAIFSKRPRCPASLFPAGKASPPPASGRRTVVSIRWLLTATLLGLLFHAEAGAADTAPPRTWPQAYSVDRNEATGILSLRTPYYTVEHDLRKGGAVTRIALTHGKAANLLARPLETRVTDAAGSVLTDLKDPSPKVSVRADGLKQFVSVESALKSDDGQASTIRLTTTIEYRWGYIKIRRQFTAPAATRVREVCPVATVLTPGLSSYGYRKGIAEEEGAGPFSFGSNTWGKLRLDQPSDPALKKDRVPRSMMFVDPGVEGLEWFTGSDLAQWELQLSGHRGQARCLLDRSQDPPGLALSIAPYASADAAAALPEGCAFDFYLAFPIIDGKAQKPWLHNSFNRNRGNWVSTDDIRAWAEKGIQTVHCHNDGDYYDDGLFWRDGSYPPYPDMDRYDKVLTDCRQNGIRTATYFSNKELHPSTAEFKQHGEAWGRKNRKGQLRHNFYRTDHEFGAQMCLRSGWLDFLKLSIDRVLENHPLDGVYYDWNVALWCSNPLHEGGADPAAPAKGHWDIDELLDLMEWTRNRVGPDGLVIVHNTTTPMFATENFADHVVATEWGYKKWTDAAPPLEELPLEWSLAGAISRGVISYGVLNDASPARLHRLFALEAMLGGVTPWPASPQAFELLPVLAPIGDIEACRFADWRNPAVHLSDPVCASAVYSRAGEAWILLANLGPETRETVCRLDPAKLPWPLQSPRTAATVAGSAGPSDPQPLDIGRLLGEGVNVSIPADSAILLHIR